MRARLPQGRRVYAVGDIHGRDDLLAQLHGKILADTRAEPADEAVVVYLGDYVDRGEQSFEVIERLLHEPLPGMRSIHLKGNHEDMMLQFLEGPPEPLWLLNGGLETLASYGIEHSAFYFDSRSLEGLRRRLAGAIPFSHLRFLRSLSLTHTEGDYLFVHAGVDPGRPLETQEERDLLWIRDRFLHSDVWLGKCVVHGHTIFPRPYVSTSRIGVDTGAFHTGRLSCAVLQGEAVRFLVS